MSLLLWYDLGILLPREYDMLLMTANMQKSRFIYIRCSTTINDVFMENITRFALDGCPEIGVQSLMSRGVKNDDDLTIYEHVFASCISAASTCIEDGVPVHTMGTFYGVLISAHVQGYAGAPLV